MTGCRADWGLLYPLARELAEDAEAFELQVVATGAHLCPRFGLTYREIEADGFAIDQKVEIPLSEDTAEAILGAVGAGIRGLTDAMRSLRPDLVFILGDRFEILPAAISCLFLKLPVAHIQGGELTEGSIDDSIRHVITKLSYLHFVSTDVYRKRVIQMGEHPSRVFCVGALGVDNVKNTELLDRRAFQAESGFALGRQNMMVTFSPPTSEEGTSATALFQNMLTALDELPEARLIFTKPNPDLYSGELGEAVDAYVAANKDRCACFTSMGRTMYLSALQFMDAVVGNSSSGIIEVPSFGIPTVNVGSRQTGRIRAESVIDAAGSLESVREALRKALSADFSQFCRNVDNPYGDGHAAERIAAVLKDISIPSTKKVFFDVDFSVPGNA